MRGGRTYDSYDSAVSYLRCDDARKMVRFRDILLRNTSLKPLNGVPVSTDGNAVLFIPLQDGWS